MAQVHPAQEISNMCFETFCEQTGWGAYSKFVIGLNVACLFLHGLASLAINLAIPSYFCDENWNEFGLFYMCFCHLLGRAFGGAIFCSCADVYGRKRIMSLAFLVIFTGAFIVAFSHNALMLVFGIAFFGCGLEALSCASHLHLTEILTTSKRAQYFLLSELFWVFGYFIVATFAIFLKESPMRVHRGLDMKLATWRIIFAASGGLGLIIACSTALLEESPRFLLHYGKHHLSMLILKQFYTINTSSYSENFKLREEELKGLIGTYRLNYPEMNNLMDQTVIYIIRYGIAVKLMFTRRFFKTTFILIVIKVATVLEMFEINVALMKILDEKKIVPLRGLAMFYYDVKVNSSSCIGQVVDSESDVTFLLLAVNMIMGVALSWIFVGLLGRKILICHALLISGIGFINFNYLTNIYCRITFGSIIVIFSMITSSLVSLITIESYPTAIRGTAIGFINMIHLIALVLFLRFIHSDLLFPVYGTSLMGAAVLSYFLTDTKNKPMVE